jgi:TolB protein
MAAKKRQACRAAVLAVSVGVALMGAAVAQATFQSENGRIVFRRYLNDDHTRAALFTVRPGGGGIKQVTHPHGLRATTEPDFSPNGRRIIYTVYPENDEDRSRMAIIRRNGTHHRSLADLCTGSCLFDGFPAWSPSGDWIAFQRGLGPKVHMNKLIAIYIMRRDGSRIHRITQKQASVGEDARWEDQAPNWSPSGRMLAFERFDRKRDRQAVFTMRRNGTRLHRITPWAMDASQPDFAPGGRWLLVRTHEGSDISGNIWLISRDGSRRHPVTHDPSGTAKWQSGSFSPDGRKIQAGRTPVVGGEQQPGTDVWTMTRNGSHLMNITQTPTKWESASDWGAKP